MGLHPLHPCTLWCWGFWGLGPPAVLGDRTEDVLGLVVGKGPPSRPGARGPGLPLPGEGGTGSVLGQRQEQTAEAGGTSGLHLVQTPLSRWPRTVSRGL